MVTPEIELWRGWRILIGSRWRVHVLLVLFLILLGEMYRLAEFSHFNFDDYQLIVLNPTIRDLKGLPAVLASGHPVRGLTFMLDYALFGLDPSGYHIHSILWHVLGSILFYALVYRLFGRPRLAGAAAVLFAMHPIHTEAVMAVAHRKDLLAFAFMLMSYHAYLYRHRYRAIALILSAFFFLLALLSKQVALVLPLIIMTQEWLKAGGGFKPRILAWAAPLLCLAALLVLGGIFYPVPIIRDFNLFGKVAPAELGHVEYGKILATSFSAYPRCFRYLLFPTHLNLTPQIPIISFGSPRAWLGILLFLSLGIAALGSRKDFLVSFSLSWIFITILPVMNWFPANDFFAERYLFTPSAGFCLLLAGMWERIHLSRAELWSRKGYESAGYLMLAFMLWLTLTSPLAIRINALWPRGVSFCMDRALALAAAGAVGAALAVLLLALGSRGRIGALARERGVYEFLLIYIVYIASFAATVTLTEYLLRRHLGFPEMDVRAEWQKTLDFMAQHARPGPRSSSALLYPYGTTVREFSMILTFLAVGASMVILIFRRWGRKFGQVHPNRKVSWEILMLVLLAVNTQVTQREGDWSSEIRLWGQTILEEPASLWAWNNLGKAYMDRRRCDLAADAYQKTVELDPGRAENYRNLGTALLCAGNLSAAQKSFEKAIRLAPGDIGSRNNLANLLVVEADQGINSSGYREAIEHYLLILKFDPQNAHAHHNLAWCYLKLGDFNQALAQIGQALFLSPQSEKSLQLKREILSAQKARARKSPERIPAPSE